MIGILVALSLLIFLWPAALTAQEDVNPVWVPDVTFGGPDFFDSFDFLYGKNTVLDRLEFSDNERAHFASKQFAIYRGLVYITDEDLPAMKGSFKLRNSVMPTSVGIVSKQSFTEGLFIFTFNRIAYGCGVTPMVSMVDERNILRNPDGNVRTSLPLTGGRVGVLQPGGRYSANLTEGCFLQSNADHQGYNVEHTCANPRAAECQWMSSVIRHETGRTAGVDTIAMLWDTQGFQMWQWERSSIPNDVAGGVPSPASWGKPSAAFALNRDSSHAGCNDKLFGSLVMVLSVELCGDQDDSHLRSVNVTTITEQTLMAIERESSRLKCATWCSKDIDNGRRHDLNMEINSIVVYKQKASTLPKKAQATSPENKTMPGEHGDIRAYTVLATIALAVLLFVLTGWTAQP